MLTSTGLIAKPHPLETLTNITFDVSTWNQAFATLHSLHASFVLNSFPWPNAYVHTPALTNGPTPQVGLELARPLSRRLGSKKNYAAGSGA